MISASAMTRRIRIERYSETRSPTTNSVIKAWILVAEVWAFRLDTSAKEFVSDGTTGNTEQLAVFTIWYRAGITPAMRLLSQGQTFNITGVIEVGQKAQLQIQAKAVNSNPST